MNHRIKIIIALFSVLLCSNRCFASLESLLPRLNEAFENIISSNISSNLPPLPSGGLFVEALLNSAQFRTLLEEDKFQKLIGMDYYEMVELFKGAPTRTPYLMESNIIKISAKRLEEPDYMERIKNNWDTLKPLFPRYVYIKSFDIANDGTLYAKVEFFKDKEGKEKFTLADCNVVVDALKNLNVVAQCLITMPYPIMLLPPKYKEQRIRNKNAIIKQLDVLEKSWPIRYRVKGYRMENGQLKPSGAVDLR